MRSLFFLIISLIFVCSCKKKDPDITPPFTPAYTIIKLDSSSFTIGNLEKGVLDTFQLHFNKPIQVNHILLVNYPCLPDLKYILSNSGKTVKFYNLLCGRLARDFEFEFLVHDQEGKTLKDTIEFSYYTRKLPTEGQIMSYFISSDNKYCWISTSDPNRIYCLGLEDTAFNRKYDLSFKPSKIVFNTYNQKLYVLNYFAYTTNVDRVYVMDPSTGSIEKTIIVTNDQYDNPQNHIVVYDLDFCSSGYGVLVTGTIEYGDSRWRILDSRVNDSIYSHLDWIASIGGGGLPFKQVFNPQANYNKAKIYMRREYAIGEGAIMNCVTQRMTVLDYTGQSNNHYIVPSKTQDKLFVAGYTYQTIMGINPPSYFSQFHNLNSETADFSYRSGDENFMYYRNMFDPVSNYYELMILDYSIGKTLMRTNVPPDFLKITGTTNGEYILATSANAIFVFKTEIFHKYI